jgi:hypothetical protein
MCLGFGRKIDVPSGYALVPMTNSQDTCEGCDFKGYDCSSVKCSKASRKDGVSVVFKLMKLSMVATEQEVINEKETV